MDLSDLRKKIFIGSQYCTYYIDDKRTVVAGIMHSFGYKFGVQLDDNKLEEIEKNTRKYNTILNSVVGLCILLYLYCFIFPYYTEIAKLHPIVMAFVLAAIPLVVLYLLYIVANKFFEKYLIKNVGQYEKCKFQATIYNIEPRAFEKYEKTPRMSKYVLCIIMALFLFYILVPPFAGILNNNKQYDSVLKLTKIYSAIIPISSDIYAQSGYAQYKLSQFKEAEKSYVLANKYSFSNSYDSEILGSQIKYMPKNEVLDNFEKAIGKAETENSKYFLMYEKAVYLQANNEYKKALDIYNELLYLYSTQDVSGFVPEYVYYNRGEVRAKLGDIKGANDDKVRAKKMCSECNFELKSNLVR